MTVVAPISEDDSPTEREQLLHTAADGSSTMDSATSPRAACITSASHRPLWRRDEKSPQHSASSSSLSRSLPFSRSAPNTPFQPIVHKLTVFSSPASTAQSPLVASRLRISVPSTPTSRAASASSSSWCALLLLWGSRLCFVAPWLLLLCLLLSRFDVGLPWLRSYPLQSPSSPLPPPLGPIPALSSSPGLYSSLAQYRNVHSTPPVPRLQPSEDHTRTALSPLPPVAAAAAAAASAAGPSTSPASLLPPPPISNLRSQEQYLQEVQQRKIAQAAADRREELQHPRGQQREQDATALVDKLKTRLLEESTAAAAALAMMAAVEQEADVVAVQQQTQTPPTAVKDRNDEQLKALLRYRRRADRPAVGAA